MDTKPIDPELEKKYLEGFHFNPITAEKQVLIQRTAPAPASSGDTLVAQLSYQFGTGKGPGVDTEGLKGILKDVEKMEQDRKEKKKSLQECNEKLANYIEKTRTLEEQIRMLVEELRTLRENWGKETARIRAMMDKPLADAREKLEKSENEKGELEVRIELLEGNIGNKKDQLEDEIKKHAVAKDKADRQQQKLTDYESELELLKRKKDFLDTEKDKLKKDNDKLKNEITKLTEDLKNESINHVKAENQANVLKEELDFLRAVWDLERKELEKLIKRDSTGENREYWKSEIDKLFRELNDQFENQLGDYRSDLTSQFEAKLQVFAKAQGVDNSKINQIRDDVQRLKNENDKLKEMLTALEPKVASLENDVQKLQKELEELKMLYDREVARLTAELNASKIEIERLMAEMRKLFDQKIALELEITQYRKMLIMNDPRAQKEEQQIAKLRDLFDEVDIDASGTLCLEEMRIVLSNKGYSDHFIQRFYCHLDINKDGYVTRQEFYKALQIIPRQIFISDKKIPDDELLAIFDEADVDHSGSVSWDEFKSTLTKKGFGTEFIKTYFDQMDLSNNSQISRAEFARCLGILIDAAPSKRL